ncbi:unnamed protein product [Rotaria sp. Silwood2]|nr:unnamed protein product [Rotaria sp. Silwood2]CAF4579054.1 unnamed protein product [Rotaria sp. Silwood2]
MSDEIGNDNASVNVQAAIAVVDENIAANDEASSGGAQIGSDHDSRYSPVSSSDGRIVPSSRQLSNLITSIKQLHSDIGNFQEDLKSSQNDFNLPNMRLSNVYFDINDIKLLVGCLVNT